MNFKDPSSTWDYANLINLTLKHSDSTYHTYKIRGKNIEVKIHLFPALTVSLNTDSIIKRFFTLFVI